LNIDSFSDEAFAAYLAGFIDGEGYIGIESAPRGLGSVNITIANCEVSVLESIRERLGVGAIYSQQQREHWRRRYVLKIGNAHDCRLALRIVRPYLQIKGEAADAMLEHVEVMCARIANRADRNRQIVELAASGMKRKDIAVHFGVSAQTISRVCNGHDWPSEMNRVAQSRNPNKLGQFIGHLREPA
jgi:uncharacterized protein YerC